MRVLAISDVEVLREHWADLEDLCSTLAEPNVFYEPWMLIPAVEAFGAGKTFTFILIFTENSVPGGKPSLCGFFPFERRRRYARMPANLLLLWEYRHCGICTPPLRRGHEKACLNALIDWAASDLAGADVIEWFQVGADGPVFRALLDCVEQRRLRHQLTRRERPLMVPRESSEVFLDEALSSNRKRGLRRWERQLSELGAVGYRELEDDRIDAWIDEFLVMEASGWKGREGVAAIHDKNTENFVRYALREAFRRKQLLTLSMTVSDSPAASRFILTSGSAAFGYKISYQEKYARYSPGSLLEVESIRRVHQHPEIQWLDSCVAPSFSHYLPWLDKRSIADITFSTGGMRGNGVLAVAPILRSLGKTLTRLRALGKKTGAKQAQQSSEVPPA
ncbi:MAG: GNAT family N-acetyltransferase [Acidobacteriia bacterium]|nr:GNAT family N-acetyltransferase [Terriglobia bacterium]